MTHPNTLTALDILEAQHSAIIVLSVDPQPSIIYCNPQFINMVFGSKNAIEFDAHLASCLQKNLNTLLELDAKGNCSVCLGRGHDFTPVHTARLKYGGVEDLRVKIKHSPLPNGTLMCTIDLFSEDVTLTQAHSDFVSTVSHEFRTPLTSIKGFADTILRYGNNLAPEQQRRFISIIKDQADRLTRLVENLLIVSKLGAARFGNLHTDGSGLNISFRPISVATWVERVIQTVKGKGENDKQFAGRNYVVALPKDLPPVWAEPDKLEQILTNLIDNAVKYSMPGTTVRIAAKTIQAPLSEVGGRNQDKGDLSAANAQKEHVSITVSDQGVGIPAEHLPRIFSKFSRIDNPLTRQVEGTGLGLYITHALTVALGGSLSVYSTEDSKAEYRTTFTLCLPTPPEIRVGEDIDPEHGFRRDEGGHAK